MKRTVLFIAVILLPVIALSAYDSIWGGRVLLNLEFPEVYGSSFAITTEDSAGVWYRGSWSPRANIEVDGGVAFDASVQLGLTTDLKFSFHGFPYEIYPELDLLNFYGTSGIFRYKAGRQSADDNAGLIVGAPYDAVEGAVNLGGHIISAGIGYTGLAFGQSAEYFLTETDLKDDGLLAASRLIGQVGWEKTGLTPWLNASAQFLAVVDLTSDDDLAEYGNEKFSPMYLELTAGGFAGQKLLYELSLVGQYGMYGDATVAAGLARLGLSWITSERSRLGVDLIGSTGDEFDRDSYVMGTNTTDSYSQYLPVSTVSTQGYVVEFELGNLIALGAFYSVRPTQTFSWELRATTIMRSAIGPMSTGLVVDNGSTSHFVGQEALMSFNWRPKSDFGWDFNLGVLYPGDSIELDSEIEPFLPVLFKLGFDFSWSF